MNVDKRYYLKDRLFSYNAFLNFSISERGLGKTTSAKMWCIDDFLRNGKRFVWLRRYNTEIVGDRKTKTEGCLKDFTKKIEKYYPNVNFMIKGNRLYINDKDAGCFVALSMSQSMKSVDFPDVNKIVFDEFIIQKNKALTYLTNEVPLFLDFLSTVFRPMENQEKTRVWLLANAITFANEYFYYFNIKPFKQQYYRDRARGIVVEQCKNEVYREAVKKTDFGKLVAGTKYESYAIENEYLLDNDDFLGKKSPTAIFQFNVRYDGQEWGIYADPYFVYVTWKIDRTQPFYSFTNKDHTLNSILLKTVKQTKFDLIIRSYQLGLVRCENIMIKNKFVDFMKLFVVK